jgi:hypothetical protein
MAQRPPPPGAGDAYQVGPAPPQPQLPHLRARGACADSSATRAVSSPLGPPSPSPPPQYARGLPPGAQQQALQQQQQQQQLRGAPGPPMAVPGQPQQQPMQRPSPQPPLQARLPQPGMLPPGGAPGAAPGMQRPPLVNPQQAALLGGGGSGAPGPAQLMAMRAAQGLAPGGGAGGPGAGAPGAVGAPLGDVYTSPVVNAEAVVAARFPVQRRLLPSGAVTVAPADETTKILPRSQLERLMRIHGLDQVRAAGAGSAWRRRPPRLWAGRALGPRGAPRARAPPCPTPGHAAPTPPSPPLPCPPDNPTPPYPTPLLDTPRASN